MCRSLPACQRRRAEPQPPRFAFHASFGAFALRYWTASKLLRQLRRLSLSGVDHVERAAVLAVFDGKSYDTADAYKPQPKFNVAAEIFEAWLRDNFEAGRVALSPDIRNESLINAQ